MHVLLGAFNVETLYFVPAGAVPMYKCTVGDEHWSAVVSVKGKVLWAMTDLSVKTIKLEVSVIIVKISIIIFLVFKIYFHP